MEGLADNEFRLLILLPGDRSEPLRCDLSTSDLTNCQPYEALSYVWGSSTDTVEIKVAGQQLAITTSLEAILFRLRQQSEPRTLWIDQVCIDQSNLAEKTSQVQKMRLIYSRCKHVLVWLGEIANHIRRDDAEGALAVMEYIAALGSENGNSIPRRPTCMSSDRLFEDAMKAFSTISITRGSWWHRVWTVQEAILPSKIYLVWGPLSLSWAIASSVSRILADSRLLRHIIVGTSANDEGITHPQLWKAITEGDLEPLVPQVVWIGNSGKDRDKPIEASIKWRDRAATEPRDNVYALTGLYTARQLPRSSSCDYSLSINQVFINFTLDLIHGPEPGSGIDLLPLALDPWHQDVAEVPGLPRWAMNMRSIPKHSTALWRTFWYYQHYKANRGLPTTGRPEYAGKHLQLTGVVIDTVDLVGNGLVYSRDITGRSPIATDDVGWPPSIRETVISWWNLLCSDESQHLPANFLRTTPPNCSQFDEFCRLVLGDTLGNTNDQPKRHTTAKDRQDLSEFLGTGNDNGIVRDHARRQLNNRRFFVTKKGLLGLGHLETLPGDEVWVFNHGRVPFTLRRMGELGISPANEQDDDYVFIGHCYVQGIMMGLGRALEDLRQRRACLY